MTGHLRLRLLWTCSCRFPYTLALSPWACVEAEHWWEGRACQSKAVHLRAAGSRRAGEEDADTALQNTSPSNLLPPTSPPPTLFSHTHIHWWSYQWPTFQYYYWRPSLWHQSLWRMLLVKTQHHQKQQVRQSPAEEAKPLVSPYIKHCQEVNCTIGQYWHWVIQVLILTILPNIKLAGTID